MELLEEMRCFRQTGFMPKYAIAEAAMLFDMGDETIDEVENPQYEDVINKIKNNEFVVNDYASFINDIKGNKRSPFLSQYSVEDFKNNNVKTFQVKDYPIGYALKPDTDGEVDIISVHNNTEIKGVGNELIKSAIKNGGTKLDHFDGFLSDFYQGLGFNEYDRYAWDDKYAPKDWDYEKYGKPDVVFRKLTR